MASQPLVSILIPAYNAERTIGETIQSALQQTWPRKEIIVVNDGSTDGTEGIARRFASRGITLVSTENRGLSAAVNYALKVSRGDYIQELDADDLLAPDKIERQLAALKEGGGRRILLSSPWAYFYYRTRGARFIRNSMWQDLSPVEWLLRKLEENLHMQNATWLVSRELAEAAGPWNEALHYDQDGEYFARVLLASDGTRFVPETGIYYRASNSNRVSYIGSSGKKKESLLVSMKLHVQYIRSLEESERVRKACLTYLQSWYGVFYPDRPDLFADLWSLAKELGGGLHEPRVSWKYVWLRPILGRRATRWAQRAIGECKSSCARNYDKTLFTIEEARKERARRAVGAVSAAQGD